MPKEKYTLKSGATIFYDDANEFKVVAGQEVELDPDEATGKTAAALLSGGLVKVSSKKATAKEEKKEEEEKGKK